MRPPPSRPYAEAARTATQLAVAWGRPWTPPCGSSLTPRCPTRTSTTANRSRLPTRSAKRSGRSTASTCSNPVLLPAAPGGHRGGAVTRARPCGLGCLDPLGTAGSSLILCMATTQEVTISDTLWARIEPLLPVHVPKPYPLGRHRRRIADRQVLPAILLCCALVANGKPWMRQGCARAQPPTAAFSNGCRRAFLPGSGTRPYQTMTT